MATKTITWPDGSTAVLTYGGQGSGNIIVQSDPNNHYESRSVQVTVKTTDGSNIQRIVTIQQAAKVRTDISNAVVTAANQTYSGTAKTPTPTVTLNGVTIPSSGYDVAYSNNTNAGTATITITGKGDYTGTATGTFTIAKASRTLSFADAYVVLAPSGNITKTATPSAGSGDGAITYSISSTTYATINSSSGKVTAKTSDGSAVVTATIAEGTNYLSASASYNLYVFATTHNFAYTGSVQNITLPPGSYKLQCWGAQGGSNAADATYGITAKAGGKGGYSEGVLTITDQLTLYAFVGGQGASSGNGGWNCGGSSTGQGSVTEGNIVKTSRFACGGGATDFALVTSTMNYSSGRNNRSSASLLSRIIVAGAGSGGSMGCMKDTREGKTVDGSSLSELIRGFIVHSTGLWTNSNNYRGALIDVTGNTGQTFKLNANSSGKYDYTFLTSTPPTTTGATVPYATGYTTDVSNITTGTVPDDAVYMWVGISGPSTDYRPASVVFTGVNTTESQIGYAGGGTTGGGYSDIYKGKQDAAGGQGGAAAFGIGGRQNSSTQAYYGGAGGAGWYGGSCTSGSTDITLVKRSGGGSGFVNIAANAQYRPSGYTGIELDSGSTTIGTSSFPSTGGGTETGHSGNGYAKITRL